MKPPQIRLAAWIAVAVSLIMLAAAAVPSGADVPKGAAPVMADAATVKRAIAADRGHVVVVNFWATWCVPCVAEFPALVRLHDNYSDRGVIVLFVSADQLPLYIRRVPSFLAAHDANFPTYILKPGNQQAAINTFDRTWQGDLPRTFIYDKRGRLVKTFGGEEETYATFERAIKPLL